MPEAARQQQRRSAFFEAVARDCLDAAEALLDEYERLAPAATAYVCRCCASRSVATPSTAERAERELCVICDAIGCDPDLDSVQCVPEA